MCPPIPWMPYNGIDREIRKSMELTSSSLNCFPTHQFWRLDWGRGEKTQFRKCSGVYMEHCLPPCSFPIGSASAYWLLLCSPFTYTAPSWDSCWKSMTLEIVTGSFGPAAFFPASSIFTYKTIRSAETEIFPQCGLRGIKWKKCSRIGTSTEHHYSNEDILSST